MAEKSSAIAGVAAAVLVVGGVAQPVAAAEPIVIEDAGSTLTAPAEFSCVSLSPLLLEGAAADLAGSREATNRLLEQMATALTSACPDLATLAVEGEDRGVSFAFEVAKDENWLLPGVAPTEQAADSADEAPEPALAADDAPPSETAATAAPAAEAQTAAAEPEAEAPDAEPEIAPGVGFAELAQFYGGLPMVKGFARLEDSDAWTRILVARAYAEQPQMLRNDDAALEVAQKMLTPVEFQQFLGPLAAKVKNYNVNNPQYYLQQLIQQLSVFERRDLAERVRTQVRPYLDQRRQTGPLKVFVAVPTQLGEYSFETGAFPFQGNPNPNYRPPVWNSINNVVPQLALNGAANGVVFPNRLMADVDQARQMDEYLRARQDAQLYFGVFVEIDPRIEGMQSNNYGYGNMPVGAPPKVDHVGLYADQNLTQMVFDFTGTLAERQAAANTVMVELGRPLLNGDSLVKTIDALNGGDAAAQAAISAFVDFSGYDEASKNQQRQSAILALDRAQPRKTVRMAATLQLQPYDEMLGGFPVRYITPNYNTATSFGLGVNLQGTLFPEITILPVDKEQAAALSQQVQSYGNFEARIEAELVQGAVAQPQNRRLDVTATFAPKRVILFGGQQNANAADRSILAKVELPEAPESPMFGTLPAFGASQ